MGAARQAGLKAGRNAGASHPLVRVRFPLLKADCPSGQWERTVNPSTYVYPGSNPGSATKGGFFGTHPFSMPLVFSALGFPQQQICRYSRGVNNDTMRHALYR